VVENYENRSFTTATPARARASTDRETAVASKPSVTYAATPSGNVINENELLGVGHMLRRATPILALSAATILTAAPAYADDTPDYSAFVNAVKAVGNPPAPDEKLRAAGDLICDSLRSGESPLDVEQDVQQGMPGFSRVQKALLVYAAQDDLCPDTEQEPPPPPQRSLPPQLPPVAGPAGA
jgi:hypothetical protein